MSREHISHERQSNQTSFYLVQRAQALLAALQFFAAPGVGTRRLLQFLAQSDFWEWELDNLIYSFTNLADRQRTWLSTSATIEKLGKLDIALNAKMVRKISWTQSRWKVRHGERRVAPVQLLAEVLAIWSQLLDAAEATFIAPMRENAQKWNINMRHDLNSLRRTMPRELEIIDQEAGMLSEDDDLDE